MAAEAIGSTQSKPRTFITLDALRGVAAIPVLLSHTPALYGHMRPAKHAGLAVDFFFMLSGFVMTYVYQERLDSGWSTRDFLRTRIIRLYPLYLCGLILGLLFQLLQNHFGKVHWPPFLMGELLVLGLLFLPTSPLMFGVDAPHAMYPFDGPAWSLFYEIVGNALHGIFLRRRYLVLAITVSVSAAVVLLWQVSRFGTLGLGANRTEYGSGIIRLLFAYPVGIILFRLWSLGKIRFRVKSLYVVILLAGSLLVPVPQALSGAYEWVIVVVVFPVLLMLGATAEQPTRFAPISRLLGAVSYPLYILHVPIYKFFEQAWTKATRHTLEQDAPWPAFLFFAILLPAVYWIGEHYDPEARKMLHARMRFRRAT